MSDTPKKRKKKTYHVRVKLSTLEFGCTVEHYTQSLAYEAIKDGLQIIVTEYKP